MWKMKKSDSGTPSRGLSRAMISMGIVSLIVALLAFAFLAILKNAQISN
jgi:hypothetical protein